MRKSDLEPCSWDAARELWPSRADAVAAAEAAATNSGNNNDNNDNHPLLVAAVPPAPFLGAAAPRSPPPHQHLPLLLRLRLRLHQHQHQHPLLLPSRSPPTPPRALPTLRRSPRPASSPWSPPLSLAVVA